MLASGRELSILGCYCAQCLCNVLFACAGSGCVYSGSGGVCQEGLKSGEAQRAVGWYAYEFNGLNRRAESRGGEKCGCVERKDIGVQSSIKRPCREINRFDILVGGK